MVFVFNGYIPEIIIMLTLKSSNDLGILLFSMHPSEWTYSWLLYCYCISFFSLYYNFLIPQYHHVLSTHPLYGWWLQTLHYLQPVVGAKNMNENMKKDVLQSVGLRYLSFGLLPPRFSLCLFNSCCPHRSLQSTKNSLAPWQDEHQQCGVPASSWGKYSHVLSIFPARVGNQDHTWASREFYFSLCILSHKCLLIFPSLNPRALKCLSRQASNIILQIQINL